LGLAGWFIVRSAQTGLSAASSFSWFYPAAGVEALAVVRTAARYGERVTTHGLTLELLGRVRARLFSSATHMDGAQLARFRSGDLLERVQADVDALDGVLLAVIVPVAACTVVAAGSLSLLALIRPTFAAIAGAGLLVAAAGDVAAGRRSKRAVAELARQRSLSRARLVEAVDGRVELAAFGAGRRAVEQLRTQFVALDPPRRRALARQSLGQAITVVVGTGVVVWELANGVGFGANPLSAPLLAFAALITMALFESAEVLSSAGEAASTARTAWHRLTEVTGLGSGESDCDADRPAFGEPGFGEPVLDPGLWSHGDVVVTGLSAGMAGPVLDIDHLRVPGSGFAVITGASGAGKSTLLRVLAGGLAPAAGSVTVGGVDPYSLDYEDLVTYVTLVEQDSRLLSGTVEENLRLARPDATAAELRNAMDVAALSGQVNLDVVLGPGGTGLSGGQRRRLGLAQAVLRRPGLLLIDEPTEGVDDLTAQSVLANLRAGLPATTIVAAIHDRTLAHLELPDHFRLELAGGSITGTQLSPLPIR
jgi:ATP-binding cassette subfamily C protein CydC